jgi:hypothetical protein
MPISIRTFMSLHSTPDCCTQALDINPIARYIHSGFLLLRSCHSYYAYRRKGGDHIARHQEQIPRPNLPHSRPPLLPPVAIASRHLHHHVHPTQQFHEPRPYCSTPSVKRGNRHFDESPEANLRMRGTRTRLLNVY